MQARTQLAHAALAVACLTATAPAQDCVDDYIALRSGTELLTGCELASSPCDAGTFDVYRVEGGGAALQSMIASLSFGLTRFTVIDVGPDAPPSAQEVYDPISIPANGFPDGLAIVARWGPTLAAIDGGFAAQCVVIEGGAGDGPIRIGAAANRLVLNDPLLPDYDGWYGFEIRNGAAFGIDDGGGVYASFLGDSLDLAGNVIHDNQGRNAGGGVRLLAPADAYVALNHVYGNALARDCFYDTGFAARGAGLYQTGGFVQLLGNRIEGNGFGELLCAAPATEPARQGGGVAVFLGSEGGPLEHFSCGNKVLENEASEGNGYWIEAIASSGNVRARLELNEVRGNTTWQPAVLTATAIEGGFRGGGVWMRGRSLALPHPPFTATLQLELVANRVVDNHVANPGLIVDPAEPDDVGGGIWSDVERNDPSDLVAIVGNAVWSNEAPVAGGGVWLDHPSTMPVPAWGDLHHDTLAWNRVAAGGLGAGIYMTDVTRFDGSSAVIWGNEVGGVAGLADGDWYAEPGVPDEFRYSQMPDDFLLGADLYGVACSDVDPDLVAGDWHLVGDASPCVDSADTGPGVDADLAALLLTVDPDGGPREVARLVPTGPPIRDRGADEFLAFLRGDVNADGVVNIADPVYLQNALFVPGSPALVCEDAGDANDDGSVNIADAITLYAYLFPTGATVFPPDLDVCQIADPTPDGLTTEPGTPCVP